VSSHSLTYLEITAVSCARPSTTENTSWLTIFRQNTVQSQTCKTHIQTFQTSKTYLRFRIQPKKILQSLRIMIQFNHWTKRAPSFTKYFRPQSVSLCSYLSPHQKSSSTCFRMRPKSPCLLTSSNVSPRNHGAFLLSFRQILSQLSSRTALVSNSQTENSALLRHAPNNQPLPCPQQRGPSIKLQTLTSLTTLSGMTLIHAKNNSAFQAAKVTRYSTKPLSTISTSP
jgi:hypothetical protein